jgi:hypothetical protein
LIFCYGQSIPQVSNNAKGQRTMSQDMGVTPRSNVNTNSGEYMRIIGYLFTKMCVAVHTDMNQCYHNDIQWRKVLFDVSKYMCYDWLVKINELQTLQESCNSISISRIEVQNQCGWKNKQ